MSPWESNPGEGGSARIPATIGNYRILSQIGEGGMGLVFKAEQAEPIKREVALKVIRGGMDTKEVMARFDAERQALALMDHPGIAKVFDGGTTESGAPYFVMELVDGVPVTDYCDGENLPLRERLELFKEICAAVQHAHQKGIIHRDLKPSNVLVSVDATGTPQPKIIDFGIAKAATGQALTDRTLFTGFMQVLGTPMYMSPEQAEISGMDIDTRTDVYALGVMLYELLAGALPFDPERFKTGSHSQIEKILWEEEPPKPSRRLGALEADQIATLATTRGTTPKRLTAQIHGELDWIIMKAIDKERGRRYQTPASLAQDIECYLLDEPVVASPPSKAYLMKKFARRHRVGIGVITALVTLLVGGIVASSWQAIRAREAEARAQQQLKITDKMMNFLLRDMIGSANPMAEPDRDMTLRAVVDRAAAKVDTSFDEETDIRFSINALLGQLYLDLGEYPKAQHHLRVANGLAPKLWGGRHNHLTARVLNGLGVAAFRGNNFDEGEEFLKASAEARRQLVGDDSKELLRTLAYLGRCKFMRGDHEEAKASLEALLPKCERVFGRSDSHTLMVLTTLAEVCQALGLEEEIEKHYAEAQIRYKEHGQENPTDPNSIDVMNNEAIVLMNQRNFEEALPLLEEAVERSRNVMGSEHSLTLVSIHNLAGVLVNLRRAKEAHPLFLEALMGERKSLGLGHDTSLSSLRDYATNCFRIGDSDEGIRRLKELVRLNHQFGKEHSQPMRWAYERLEQSLAKLGREDEMAAVVREITNEISWVPAETRVLIEKGSSWWYFDGGGETSPDALDAGWREGDAPLGYGDSSLNTQLGFGGNAEEKFPRTWFRRSFEVGDEAFSKLKCRVRFDDRVRATLNGQPLFASDPERSADGIGEKLYYVFVVDSSELVQGPNVIEVELSQSRPDSSDLIFDLQLEGLARKAD